MNKINIFILLLVLFVPSIEAAITLDTQTTAEEHDGPNTLTTSFTVGSNSNRMLVVFVHNDHTNYTTDVVPNSVTYNGVSLTMAVSKTYWSAQASASIWYLQAPDTGTHDVVTTYETGFTGHFQHHIWSLYNVKQQAPEATASAESTQATITTITNNAMVIAGVGRNSYTTPDIGAISSGYSNEMAQWDEPVYNTQSRSASKIVTSAGNETPSSTTSNARVVVAVAFEEEAAAPASRRVTIVE